MYTIDVFVSPALYEPHTMKQPYTAVAVDILRATTAICAAFTAGAEMIVPLTSISQLPKYRHNGFHIAAERNGIKIMQAEFGNSPTEYLKMDLTGKRIAFSSTNGTSCILKTAHANRSYVGSFSNISVLLKQLTEKPQNTVVVCSGWNQDAGIEDVLFAGEVAQRLIESGLFTAGNDSTHMAIDLWNIAQNNLLQYSSKASHVKRLQRLGYQNDIEFAFQHDTCHCLPKLNPINQLVLAEI